MTSAIYSTILIIKRLFYASQSLKIMKLAAFLLMFSLVGFTGLQAFNTLNAYQETHLNRLNTYLEVNN